MSDPDTAAKSPRHSNRFAVEHQHKQQLLLRALERMDTSQETADETRAIVEMITRLEEILGRRKRRRVLAKAQPATHRKRCSYGSREINPHKTLTEA